MDKEKKSDGEGRGEGAREGTGGAETGTACQVLLPASCSPHQAPRHSGWVGAAVTKGPPMPSADRVHASVILMQLLKAPAS